MRDTTPAGQMTERIMADVQHAIYFADGESYNKAWGIINQIFKNGRSVDNYDAVIVLLGQGFKLQERHEKKMRQLGIKDLRHGLQTAQKAAQDLHAKARKVWGKKFF